MLAVALLRQGDSLRAQEHFEEAIGIDPGLAAARANLAVLLAQAPGRMPDAIAQLEAALKISSDPQWELVLRDMKKKMKP